MSNKFLKIEEQAKPFPDKLDFYKSQPTDQNIDTQLLNSHLLKEQQDLSN